MQPQFERLTDDQWKGIKVFLNWQRPRKYDLREIFDAILWITRTGTQWRNLDSSFPHWKIVYYYFETWGKKGIFEQMCRKGSGMISAWPMLPLAIWQTATSWPCLTYFASVPKQPISKSSGWQPTANTLIYFVPPYLDIQFVSAHRGPASSRMKKSLPGIVGMLLN